MGCRKCSHYSFKLVRCLLGKVNPKTRKNTHQTARTMGWSYICLNNKWKQQAIREMDEIQDRRPQPEYEYVKKLGDMSA